MSVATVDCAVDIWTDIIAQQETKLRNAFDRGAGRKKYSFNNHDIYSLSKRALYITSA
jgi:hypothetical protein